MLHGTVGFACFLEHDDAREVVQPVADVDRQSADQSLHAFVSRPSIFSFLFFNDFACFALCFCGDIPPAPRKGTFRGVPTFPALFVSCSCLLLSC